MSDKIHVATRKGLFTVERAASGWEVHGPAFLGDRVTMVFHDRRDGALYAALDAGHFGAKLHRSEDGGTTWSEVGVPSYESLAAPAGDAARPDGTGAEDEDKKKGPSLELIWALESAGDDRPGTLWAGTIPGGLFLSRDRGDTWQLNRPLWDRPERKTWFGGGYDQPGIHSVVVDPRDSRHVTVGVSCGGAWVSRDSGETWECRTRGMWAAYMPPERKEDPAIQDPHRIVQCHGSPDVLWTQHHNGIFRSTDAGETWTEVKNAEPSNFGFAVAVHPSEPTTAWFVPAVKDECRLPVDGRFVVSRTRDAGETFDVLREGLPQQRAYDLVFRHALDVDASGDRLAVGSTTGGLWVTEDQGDHWRTVAVHLPPIYCVRFS